MKNYIIAGLIIFGLLLSGCVGDNAIQGKELSSFQEVRDEIVNDGAIKCSYEDANGSAIMFISKYETRINMETPFTGEMKMYSLYEDGKQIIYTWGEGFNALAAATPGMEMPEGNIGFTDSREYSQEEYDAMWAEDESNELLQFDERYKCFSVSKSSIEGPPSDVEFLNPNELANTSME
jgi:hypothetical protein